MKITLLEPISYCNGVENAINTLETAISENPNKQILVYGEIIHNLFIIRKYISEGVIFIDKNEESVKTLDKDSILVIPAHGAPQTILEIAKEKNIKIYEATCPFIKENIKLIKNAIKEDRDVIYIGEESHDESKAILSISNKVYLLDKERLKNYYFITKNNPLLVCQSTLEEDYLQEQLKTILSRFPESENKARICQTTSARQKAIINNIDDDVDLILIVGDKNSNNTKKLLDTAKRHHPNKQSMLVGSFLELRRDFIKNKNHIAIASGASTPKYIIDAVVSFINQMTTFDIFS